MEELLEKGRTTTVQTIEADGECRLRSIGVDGDDDDGRGVTVVVADVDADRGNKTSTEPPTAGTKRSHHKLSQTTPASPTAHLTNSYSGKAFCRSSTYF